MISAAKANESKSSNARYHKDHLQDILISALHASQELKVKT